MQTLIITRRATSKSQGLDPCLDHGISDMHLFPCTISPRIFFLTHLLIVFSFDTSTVLDILMRPKRFEGPTDFLVHVLGSIKARKVPNHLDRLRDLSNNEWVQMASHV